MRKLTTTAAVAAALAGLASNAWAEGTIKIGVVTTLTTPAASLGNEMRAGFDLALEHLGGEVAGHAIELIYEDDALRPEVGRQVADKLVQQDGVPIVTGFIWSNVLLAASTTVLGKDAFLISANAGPSQLAGRNCHEDFFNVSWQNDQTPMAMGEVLNQRDVQSVYIMAPNYAAGQQFAGAVEATFSGEVVGSDLTRWGADAQLDFSAELAKVRASGADALWAFYPGRAGSAFLSQFLQSGLGEEMELYTNFTIDEISLPRFQEGGLDSVIGSLFTQSWGTDLETPENAKFVEAFKAEHGREPSFYAAQAYDTMHFIAEALAAVEGNVDDRDALREAMKAVNYLPTRGAFSVGTNHFPVQNFYLREAIVGEDGTWTTRIVSTVYENHVDPHAKDCKL